MTKLTTEEDTDHAYSVVFSVGRTLSGSFQEPDDYIVEINGHISDETEEVGRMTGYIIQVGRALEERQNLFEACDAHSQTVEDYYEALFDFDTGEVKESIQEQLDSFQIGEILILDRIEVLPAHRKRGLGLAVACSFIDTFGGNTHGLAVGLPHPLQFSAEGKESEWSKMMQFENLPTDEKLATKKLEDYWAKLGMKCLKGIDIRGSKVYALSLDQRRPTMAQLATDL